MQATRDENKLDVFIEGRKRKTYVGSLERSSEQKYTFYYDKKYLKSGNAIPLGPDIPLSKAKHEIKGKLFATFVDRIPSKRNPAYGDYCRQEGISPNEKNPIILLGTIGKRGPSSFVFESVMRNHYLVEEDIKKFKASTGLSFKDIALAFDINYVTLYKITNERSSDSTTTKLIRLYLNYPNCLADQLQFTSKYLHHQAVETIMYYLKQNNLIS